MNKDSYRDNNDGKDPLAPDIKIFFSEGEIPYIILVKDILNGFFNCKANNKRAPPPSSPLHSPPGTLLGGNRKGKPDYVSLLRAFPFK